MPSIDAVLLRHEVCAVVRIAQAPALSQAIRMLETLSFNFELVLELVSEGHCRLLNVLYVDKARVVATMVEPVVLRRRPTALDLIQAARHNVLSILNTEECASRRHILLVRFEL